MDLALLVSAGIALVGLVLTVLFLPQVNASKKPLTPGMDTEGGGVRRVAGDRRPGCVKLTAATILTQTSAGTDVHSSLPSHPPATTPCPSTCSVGR